MVDITPLIAEGKHMIRGYGDGGFTVRDTCYKHSLIVYPDEVFEWKLRNIKYLTINDFSDIIARQDVANIVLLGCGEKQEFLPSELESELKSNGLIVEVMDTGAACRTYNALMAEERSVVAVLIAI